MTRSKAIASSLAALLLVCLVSDTADARSRRHCRHQRQRQCCAQTCHNHSMPSSSCGCGEISYDSSGSQYDSQQSNYSPQSAPDAAPEPPSNQNQSTNQTSNQSTNRNSGQDSYDSDQNLTPDESEAPLRPGSSNER